MDRRALISQVIAEIDRVFGDNGFHGEPEQYAWLEEHYGITEEDDIRWQQICEYEGDDLMEEDEENEDLMSFLESDGAVTRFLTMLLVRYHSSKSTYPRHSP